MREIKFRAWILDEKRFAFSGRGTGYYFTIGGIYEDLRVLYDITGNIIYTSDWEQFTGLRDYQDNDIYEGDIVRSQYTYPLIVMYANNGELLFDESPYQSVYDDEKWIILGNIHENDYRKIYLEHINRK